RARARATTRHARVGVVTDDAGGPVLGTADASPQHGDRGDRDVAGTANVSLSEARGVAYALPRCRHGGSAGAEAAEGNTGGQDQTPDDPAAASPGGCLRC